MIDKYRWLFYAGIFIGLLISIISGLIFYDRSAIRPHCPYFVQPPEQMFKRNQITVPCLAPFQLSPGRQGAVSDDPHAEII
jgi:hypothetical protein